VLLLLPHRYYHKKPYSIIYYSARCAETRQRMAFGACFVIQLADLKPGCFAFQH
jgi:hypothetical protein